MLTKQYLFRRWIRGNDAIAELDLKEAALRASPSAEFAQRIVTMRRSMRMTQQELANELGISRASVAFMETGRTSSARKHIPKLAEIFGVPPDLFLTGLVEANVTQELSADENDLVMLYRQLPPEGKISAQKWMERQTRRVMMEPPEAAD